ncbi:MAG TPA: carboxypeptidase-like regulatory domain-containing protein, partial [Balneolaceae bacterium]|nr:carboxypeptidase-like regulatory domain-containing protein [Balneolaceae bacterium]
MKNILHFAFALIGVLGISFSSFNPASAIPSMVETVVTGTVIDAANGEPLPGVNITVKDKLAGTSTNSQGEFRLTISQD